jgi:DNA-directed RNA polymerase subunit RPC12/RpoP
MPTRDSAAHGTNAPRSATKMWHRCLLWTLVGVTLVLSAGCSKEPGMAAVETDANGYFCGNCRAKMFTARKVFLENCPKCGQNALADVVGYWCVQDQHLTIRPKVPGPEGASVCEQCGAHLRNAMVSPREKDLKAWGATKTQPR